MQQLSPAPARALELTSYELSRIVDFLRKLRGPFDTGMPGAAKDVFWKLVLEPVDAHLRRRPIDKSGLVTLAGVTYSTGNRMITKMIADSLIRQVPQRRPENAFSGTHRRASAQLHGLRHTCEGHLAKTFGLRKGTEANEYYFGGSYFAAQMI